MIKIWKISIALLLVFALAACSSDDGDDAPSITTYDFASLMKQHR